MPTFFRTPLPLLAACTVLAGVPVGCKTARPAATATVRQAETPALRPTTVLLNAADIAAIRKNKAAFADILAKATSELGYQAQPVETFAPDPHYTATGVNTNNNTARQLENDARTAYRAGLAYALTGEDRFAANAQHIIDAYAGTLKRVTTKQGDGDINFNLPYLIAAASWTRNANKWNSSRFDAFLRNTILPISQSKIEGNHGMWGVMMETFAAAYLGDQALLSKARTRWAALVNESMAENGVMQAEIERSATSNWRGGPDKGIRGMAYTHYALLPLALSAKIYDDLGQPLWNTPEGRRFQASFNQAAAWTLHPETFPFYASNDGKLQGVREAAYFNVLLRYLKNQDAEAVVAQGDLQRNDFYLNEIFGRSGR